MRTSRGAPRPGLSSRGSNSSRESSRSRRLSRFLATAVWRWRGTTMPTLEYGAEDGASKISRCAVLRRAPLRKRCRISSPVVIRRERGNRRELRELSIRGDAAPAPRPSGTTSSRSGPRGACVPSSADAKASFAHYASSYGPGTRACSSAFGCADCMSAFPYSLSNMKFPEPVSIPEVPCFGQVLPPPPATGRSLRERPGGGRSARLTYPHFRPSLGAHFGIRPPLAR